MNSYVTAILWRNDSMKDRRLIRVFTLAVDAAKQEYGLDAHPYLVFFSAMLAD